MKKIKIKKNTGITFVALIIAIIIILILSGVTINLAIGNGGILNKAKQATDKYEIAKDKEQNDLNKYDTQIASSRETVTIDKNEYEEMKATIQQIKKITTEKYFEEYKGNATFNAYTTTTIKSFTNLEPGKYLVLYKQYVPEGRKWILFYK